MVFRDPSKPTHSVGVLLSGPSNPNHSVILWFRGSVPWAQSLFPMVQAQGALGELVTEDVPAPLGEPRSGRPTTIARL